MKSLEGPQREPVPPSIGEDDSGRLNQGATHSPTSCLRDWPWSPT